MRAGGGGGEGCGEGGMGEGGGESAAGGEGTAEFNEEQGAIPVILVNNSDAANKEAVNTRVSVSDVYDLCHKHCSFEGRKKAGNTKFLQGCERSQYQNYYSRTQLCCTFPFFAKSSTAIVTLYNSRPISSKSHLGYPNLPLHSHQF